jgi:hypothetical protein
VSFLLDTNILSAHLRRPAGLAQRIQALKSSHNIEATPERPRSRNTSAAEAITARIRRRTTRQPTAEPIPESDSAAPANEPAIVATPPEAPSTAAAAVAEDSEPTSTQPSCPALVAASDHRPPGRHPAPPLRPAYRERVARGKAKSDHQLSLF